MASPQKPPAPPKPIHVHREPNFRKTDVPELPPKLPVIEWLRQAADEIHPHAKSSPSDAVKKINQVKHVPLKTCDPNVLHVSSQSYATKPVHSAHPRDQRTVKNSKWAAKDILKQHDPLKVRKSPAQAIYKRIQRSSHIPQEHQHHRAMDEGRPPDVRSLRGPRQSQHRKEHLGYYVNENVPHFPQQADRIPARHVPQPQPSHNTLVSKTLKTAKYYPDLATASNHMLPVQPAQHRDPASKYQDDPAHVAVPRGIAPKAMPPKKRRINSARIPNPPPAPAVPLTPPSPPLSAYIFTEHPLSLTFKHHTQTYLNELRSKHPQSLRETHDRLSTLHKKKQTREVSLLARFKVSAMDAFKPLKPEPSSNGAGTVHDQLTVWKDQARAEFANYKGLQDAYEHTLKRVKAFSDDVHEATPDAGVYAQKADCIWKVYGRDKKQLFNMTRNDMISIARQYEREDKAAKTRVQKMRRNTEAMLRELAEGDENGSEGAEGV